MDHLLLTILAEWLAFEPLTPSADDLAFLSERAWAERVLYVFVKEIA